MKKILLTIGILSIISILGYVGHKVYADIYSTNLVAWYRMDSNDTSGTTLYDRSKAGNNATFSSFTNDFGKIGQSVNIAGTATNNIDFGEPASLVTNLDNMTITAWTKMTNNNSQNAFVTWSDGNTFGAGHQELTTDIDTRVGQFVIRYGTSLDGTGCYGVASYPNDGNWHFVAIAKSSTNTEPAGYPSIYVDNKLMSFSETCTVNAWYTPGNAIFTALDENNVGILRRNTSVIPFYGKIDDLRIYNTVLSANDIAQIYQQGQKLFNSF